MLTLDVMKRGGHDAVQARIRETLQQKSLKHVDAPFGRPRARASETRLKGWNPAQPDATTDHRMRGNPAQQKRDAWTQPDADQHRRGR